MQDNQDDLQKKLIWATITRYEGLIASEIRDARRLLLETLLAHQKRALQVVDALECWGVKIPENPAPSMCSGVDAVGHFAPVANISTLFTNFAEEPDMSKRVMLSRLLVEEANACGERARRLGQLDIYIAKCDAQIAKHSALLDCDANQDLVQVLLRNIKAFKLRLRSSHQVAPIDWRALNRPRPGL